MCPVEETKSIQRPVKAETRQVPAAPVLFRGRTGPGLKGTRGRPDPLLLFERCKNGPCARCMVQSGCPWSPREPQGCFKHNKQQTNHSVPFQVPARSLSKEVCHSRCRGHMSRQDVTKPSDGCALLTVVVDSLLLSCVPESEDD